MLNLNLHSLYKHFKPGNVLLLYVTCSKQNTQQESTESSKYYAQPQTAVACGLDLPTRGLAGRQTAAASKHCVISVYFPSRCSRASMYTCKAETLAFTDCDYC